jgi:hypothetical protein
MVTVLKELTENHFQQFFKAWQRHASTRMFPKVYSLAACSKNCKWYSFLPLGAIVSLFCESV